MIQRKGNLQVCKSFPTSLNFAAFSSEESVMATATTSIVDHTLRIADLFPRADLAVTVRLELHLLVVHCHRQSLGACSSRVFGTAPHDIWLLLKGFRRA